MRGREAAPSVYFYEKMQWPVLFLFDFEKPELWFFEAGEARLKKLSNNLAKKPLFWAVSHPSMAQKAEVLLKFVLYFLKRPGLSF